MSYVRVIMNEVPSSMTWSETMKLFRKSVEPGLNGFKKQKIIANWSFVQAGDQTGMVIVEFDTKAKMNQYIKKMAGIRQDIQADTGMQSWVYHGPVKASG